MLEAMKAQVGKVEQKVENEDKEKKFKDTKVFKVINSPISIIIVLALLVVGLMLYSRFLIKSTTLYRFSAYTEDFSIINGTVFTNHNLNYFGDSKVIYTGKDMDLYDFKVGYYIKNDNEYTTIGEYKGLDTANEEGAHASLKEILLNMDLSFTETHKDAEYMSEENIKNIDKMVFRITGKDKDDKDINIEIPVDVEKVTK